MSIKFLPLKRAVRTALLVLLMSAVGLTNAMAQSFTVGNLNYSVNSDGVSVTLTGHVDGTSATGPLVIPESVTYNGTAYTVTTIGWFAFSGCRGFTGSLTIPNSVTTISNYAFNNCRGFTGSLTIPNSVTTIGNWAFDGCRGFTGSLTIGNSVTTIGDMAFSGGSGFSSLMSLAETPPSLGSYPFSYSNSKPVYVPCGHEEAYSSVSWGGFNDFIGLCGGTVIVMADPEECGTVMGGGQFEAGQLCTVTATANEGYAFANWTINGTIVSIEADYIFYVPSDMTLVAHFVQEGNITFADANVKAICVEHWDTNGDGELSYAEAASVTNMCNIYGESYFMYNSSISSFEELQYFIGLSSIPVEAFCYCENLSGNLLIPNSVTTIGSSAFEGCSGFTGSLIIPNSLTSIGSWAFSGCSGFTGSLTIPNSVTTIGECAFLDCGGFTGNLTIGNSVTTIGNAAFQGCGGFTGSLIIPTSVTTIEESSFKNCGGFTGSLTIGNSVTTIGAGAFQGCSGLTGSLIIPTSVTTIGNSAFNGCSGFTGDLVIPNSVATIERDVFSGCSGLNGSLVIGDGVTEIYSYTFNNCGFTGSLIIGNSVTTIAYDAFRHCSFTGSLVIGSSVTSIDNAFSSYNIGFTEINSKCVTPPTLGSSTFDGFSNSIPVYVPCGTQAIYKRASGWSSFTNYHERPAEIVVSVNSEMLGEASISQYGTCSNTVSTVHAEPKTGGVFSNWTVDGIVVSTDADYTFNLTEDVVLVANFEVASNYNFFVGTNSNLWSEANNWLPQQLPSEGSTVILYADAEINDEASVLNLYSERNALTIKPEGNLSVTDDMQMYGGDNNWYYYDDGIRINRFGYNGENFYWGVMFPAGSYTGTMLEKISAFDCMPMNGVVTIYNDGSNAPANPIGSMEIAFTGSEDFVEFGFGEPVGIDSTKNVWVIFYNASGATYPAALCADAGDPNGRWYSYDGSDWDDIGSFPYGINRTFMIRANFICPPSIIIEDGGQLYHTTDSVVATVQKTIMPYTSGTKDGWHLIAHPMVENMDVASVKNLTSNEYDLYYYDEPTVYWINQEATENNYTQMEASKGYLYANNCGFTLNYDYDFDDGTMQGWTNIDADGDGYEWHVVSDASTSHNGGGHIGSESWKYNPGPGALFPDNYIVSPQVHFGSTSSIRFWACAEDANFPAEYFGVAVSTTGNTDTTDFTTVQEWTMNAKTGRNIGTWYEYMVNLDQYAGQTGYVAIRHFNCSEQGALLIDDITLSGMMESLEAMTLNFTGVINNGSATVNVPLSYTTGHALQGFNLVGNPYAHNVTSYASVNVANGCYVMNEAKDDLIVSEISEENPLKPAEGFFVKATAAGASITFNPGRGSTAKQSGTIRVELMENDKLIDRLLVKTAEGQPLEKFSLNERRTRLFAQSECQELAIVPCEGNEQAVNFKAAKNGQYTISVNADGMDFSYLHLIDNLTGADVDLLAEPSYIFEAKTSDYASRFKLVFSACGDADGDNETFAFISNGNIVITDADANATLQIVDVTGRVVVSSDAACNVSTSGMSAGVYVLRLINGNDVRTQKIVVE